MVLRLEISVSVVSSRAISQIVVLAIFQTIALPTELPRREPHSVGDARRRSRAKYRNGLEDYSRGPEQWVCAIERGVDETIALWGSIETPRPLPFLDHVSPGLREGPTRAVVRRRNCS